MDAFLAAARGGDLGGLLAILDPDVVLRADSGAMLQSFTIADGKIAAIDILADPDRLAALDLTGLDDEG